MKNYDAVKRAADAALRGLCRTIADNLFIELSMSLFTASLDFNLPFEKFAIDLAHKQTNYMLTLTEAATTIKRAIDAGEGDNYDIKEI